MNIDPLFILATIAVLVVLIILMFGLGTYMKGGGFAQRNSNRLMRYRIAAQAVAVILIVAFAWLQSRGAN